MNIVDFLKARLAEEERRAAAVKPLEYTTDMGGQRQYDIFTHGRLRFSSSDGAARRVPDMGEHAFFSAITPERVLAEIEAKSELLRRVENVVEYIDATREHEAYKYDRMLLRLIAPLVAPYSDHPDFDPTWRHA